MFRAPAAASLECCSFIDDKEFLSGSDDGSIELWSLMRKKPTFIVRNAHPSLDSDDQELPKGKHHVGIVLSLNARISYCDIWVSVLLP